MISPAICYFCQLLYTSKQQNLMEAVGIEKIKLLIITPTLECGGSEKYVSLLCSHIDSSKFSVTLAVLNNARPFYNINNPAIAIKDLQVKHARRSLHKIKKLVRLEKPAIIFSTANHVNVLLAFCRWLFPKNIVMIARESSLVTMNKRRVKFPFLYEWMVKKYYRRFDHIICQSKFMQQDLVHHYNIDKQQTTIINNPVEKNDMIVDIPQHNKFITVARLSPEKGIARLIRSVANLSMPFKFHIIGDGDKKAALQELVFSLQLEDKVFFEGEKTDPFAGMENAALFLMGSYFEGFPNSLLEAAALGIPSVAFDAPGGINEIVVEGKNGLLVKDGDEKGFAFAIEKALHMNFNRQQIKAAVLERFSLSTIIPATEQLFMQLYRDRINK
jgi:glycosyltransferase involved in cell wall biosynthesis